MIKERRKQRSSNQLRGLSSTVMLLVILAVWMISAGCANRVILHPLQDDFKFLKAGEDFKAPKSGAFVSDYWLNKIAEVEVEL